MTANHEHTPTTERVRGLYAAAVYEFNVGGSAPDPDAEFDRWLATVEAAAEQRGKEQGWDEAMTTQIQRLISGDPDVERFQMPANPYRADRLEGDDGDV